MSASASSSGLSPSIIAGVVITCLAVLGLSLVLALYYVRGRSLQNKDVENQSTVVEKRVSITSFNEVSEKMHNIMYTGGVKPVGRPYLTSSVVLPSRAPVPSVPAAKKSSTGPTSPHAFGFNELDIDIDFTPFSPAPFSPSVGRPGSISVSRDSIVGSRKNSMGSLSSAGSATIIEPAPSSPLSKDPDLVEVRSIFTPRLPDELVLRQGEKLTLIRSFSDGWCIVGRKSPFCVPQSPGGFGKHSPDEDIEIGAVPLWVFEQSLTPGEKERPRPSRTASMGVNVVLSDEEEESARS